MEQKHTPEELIRKYNEGTCNQEEKAIVESWHLNELVRSTFEPAEETISAVNAKMRLAIIAHARQDQVTRKLWPRLAAAAAILVFLSTGLYTYFHKARNPQTYVNDIAPGTTNPVLTLANGKKVILDDKNSEALTQQSIIAVKHNASGQLVYMALKAADTDDHFNTLTNPRGSKVISLVLPDGTLAKLEAASSITYPTAFAGNNRQVATTGKVYLAVTYDKNKPFFTSTKGQTIKDLGTQFIVDAYDDEPIIRTTLIEGSVKVSKADKSTLLKPGQQSVLQAGNNTIAVKTADMGKETAWIDGDFNFRNEELGSIMRELTRVYDIEDITYQDGTQNLLFYGMVSRSRNLSAVLSLMESTGKIHFEIKGRRVVVLAGAR
ncbi:MAG TPA: FecR domain-containing protein [Mucilaginibacter sp.]|nr:FecR domain-containing protein [Mucilaginibacter sp.]